MMMKNNKRGQAALEFLTTYGWAFLVILVMIGALGYFGILNPSKFLPDRCSVGPQFACNDFQLNAGTSAVSIILQNNVGKAINLDNTTIDLSLDGASIAAGTADCSAQGPIAAGEKFTVVCNTSNSLPIAGEKAKVVLTADYDVTGKTFTKSLNVEVYAQTV